LVLIPSRYDSSRFPGKPLATFANNSMISHVYERAASLKQLMGGEIEVAVVTDDDRIENHLKAKGQNVVRVDDPVESGTERIFLAWQRYFKERSFDFIINVQGDEPLLEGRDLQELLEFHHKSVFDIATIVSEKTDFSEFGDPNRVKAVYEKEDGRCHYFSRASVPHDRDGGLLKSWYLHIGVYSYRVDALKKFCKNPVSELERIEKLEQLRALGLGLTLGAVQAKHEFIGVDLPEDIKKVEGVLG
jgi:3-deoxy-manno-octulosonate cytidylyltransferase (CMP-KDO synthetase)